MELKNGTVKIQGITTELLFGLFVADYVWKTYDKELVITSLNDGKHSKLSSHYSGNAADLRINYFKPTDKFLIGKTLQRKLGIDYDVIIEKDHIHLQYKPKRR
jgi:hypothetical protein